MSLRIKPRWWKFNPLAQVLHIASFNTMEPIFYGEEEVKNALRRASVQDLGLEKVQF